MTERKSCPFCESTDTAIVVGIDNGYPSHQISMDCASYRVICLDCGASSGWWEDKDTAIEKWNTRHYPPEVQQAVERMKPMKGVIRTDNFLESECCYCPSCDTYLEPPYEFSDFCPDCGQRLDWSE